MPPAIPQFFAPGATGGLRPAILGAARLRFTDRKLGVDQTKDVAFVTAIEEGAVPVDWEHALPAPFRVEDLSQTPFGEITFEAVPTPGTRTASYTAWTKAFSSWLSQSQSVEILVARRLKQSSLPDESERDFRIRLQTTVRERQDDAKLRVTDKYATRLRQLDDRIRRAEATLSREQGQVGDQKLQTAVSFGAAVLGAVFGRKAISAGSIGKATTAARGVGRIGRETRDVARATAALEDLVKRRAALDAAMEDELHAAHDAFDAFTEPLEPVPVKPARGGISVQQVGIVWLTPA